MVPPAPPTFSTRNCLPSTLVMPAPMMRVMASPGPPAAYGIMTVTALVGKSCAAAPVMAARPMAAMAAHILIMAFPLWLAPFHSVRLGRSTGELRPVVAFDGWDGEEARHVAAADVVGARQGDAAARNCR